MNKLTTFNGGPITYIDSQDVTQGVKAELYSFDDNTSKDLAIVRVSAGCRTPLQRVIKGDKTVEGHLEGTGTLEITQPDGTHTVYNYPNTSYSETSVAIGETMQWTAITDLVFYEICWPPYEDGRFENLG